MSNPANIAATTQMTKIVHIVDDDEAVRDSLRMLCVAANFQAKTYSSAAALLRSISPACDGCIVLDVRMPGMTGLELHEELYKLKIRMPVIFLTGHADVPIAVRAMKLGAFDFIEKPPEPQSLILLIGNSLRVGKTEDNRCPTPSKISAIPAIEQERLLSKLSGREREVLGMVVNGMQSREIADTLSLSVKTVEFHRARIREKLGLSSTLELVRLFCS